MKGVILMISEGRPEMPPQDASRPQMTPGLNEDLWANGAMPVAAAKRFGVVL
ncbi:MAG TPA: hypothetical protein VMQ86_20100 [Bryobacteraceae bacterium]|nr:hypothetical protein [Bryobacteraceae bacterium]